MTLAEKIGIDLAAARKTGDTVKRQVLGMAQAAIINARIAKKVEKLTDADVVTVLAKEAKSRRESAVEFRKGGAEERAKTEEAEAQVLENYLPAQLSEAELEKAVVATIAKLGVKDAKQMGQVMGALSKDLKGKADLKKVNALVRAKLGA